MKIKVGVFFGGRSVEHEISIISAIQAINNFDADKYEIIPIYISKDNNMYVGDDVGNIEKYKDIKLLLSKSQRVILMSDEDKVKIVKFPFKKFGNSFYDYIDVAFPIVHGTNVEDGALQGFFKTLNLPFVGCNVLASAVGMDKCVMKTILKESNVPVLNCRCLSIKEYNDDITKVVNDIETYVSYPVIVKPVNLGSSIGIKIGKNKEEVIEALDYAFQFSRKVLVEKAIINLKEINCSVLGDADEAIASECEEPVNTDDILSYEDKYMSNKKSNSKGMANFQRKLPADISKKLKDKIQQLAIKTFQTLGCNGVARIDFMIDLDTSELYVNEINTIPGSLAFYLWNAANISYPNLLDKMINLSLKREREEQGISYSFDTNILSGVNLNGLKGSKKN